MSEDRRKFFFPKIDVPHNYQPYNHVSIDRRDEKEKTFSENIENSIVNELIKEFLNDLENRVLCWEGTQTERNVVKIIKKWKERLENE